MKPMYEAKATATGGRAGHVATSDGLIDFDLSLPEGLGGPGGAKSNPEMLFAAGYSACFGSAIDFVAAQHKATLTENRVTATVGIGQREGGGFQLAVRLEVHLKGVSAEDAKKIVDEAHQVCPYSHATRNNVNVELAVV